AYHNVITGFRSPPVVIAYLVALLALGAHLYHGLWSSCQTLGLNHPKYNHLRRPIALAVAALMVLGYASIPVAVMLGLVR
ncbi:MAG: hypothetical protein HUU35_11360, partial [Armatimonadetes bacterium]|nr:hypothetical protein [Armatimonadota bacterium]